MNNNKLIDLKNKIKYCQLIIKNTTEIKFKKEKQYLKCLEHLLSLLPVNKPIDDEWCKALCCVLDNTELSIKFKKLY